MSTQLLVERLPGSLRLVFQAILAGALLIAGCGGSSSEDTPRGSREQLTRIDELQRIKASPQSCADNDDCPAGSFCDAATAQCDWHCLADSDCGQGNICSAVGTCIAGVAQISNSDPSCDLLSVAERRAALIALAGSIDPPSCADDNECSICGSYCDQVGGAVCAVECLPPGLDDEPPPAHLELGCAAGEVCSPLGRCVPDVTPPLPPPPFQFTVATSVEAIEVSQPSAALREVTLQLVTNDLAALKSEHDALVKITAAGIFADGDPRPLVKCAAGDTPAAACVFDGGWQWNVNSGDVRSAPRTFWIEIPAVTATSTWTVEARTEYAVVPGKVAVQSAPFDIPDTDPGRYLGTLSFANGGAGVADADELVVPIEALVTETHIAVIEPTRVLLPAGHVVVARDPAKATMTSWLTAAVGQTGASYTVRFDLDSTAYDAADGDLTGQLSLTTGDGNGAQPIALALSYQGPLPDPVCVFDAQCGSNAHCESVMDRCLPGPASVSAIVEDLSAASTPSATLVAKTYEDWAPSLPDLVAGAGNKLAGTGVEGFEQAYCFHDPMQPGPASLDRGGEPVLPSGDLKCRPSAGEEYAQVTFGLANRDRQFTPATPQSAAFDLFTTCKNELAAEPTASPLAIKDCVSLARFFLALRASNPNGVPMSMGIDGQRLISQLLRQWLNVNAYVAGTAVQVREFDDVVDGTGAAAHERLGSVLDLVEGGLRVMLDPRVRPQFRSGSELRRVTHSPDYRRRHRPFARWTFNDPSLPGREVEAGDTVMSLDADTGQKWLVCNKPGAYAHTRSRFHHDALIEDDLHFTIVLSLGVASYPRNGQDTFVLFDKHGDQDVEGNSHRLWIEARTNAPGTADATLSLTMKDSEGGVVSFPPLPGNADGHWGYLAVVADGDDYRIYQQRAGQQREVLAGQVAGNGVRWGGDGDLSLRCDLPSSAQCRSWHRYLPGDYLAGVWVHPERFATPTYTVIQSSYTIDQWQCDANATSYRHGQIANLWPDPPSSAVANYTVHSGAPIISTRDRAANFQWDITYRCPLTERNYPEAPVWWLPVCGAAWGDGLYTDYGIHYDEISLWNHALTETEFSLMASRYGFVADNESLPPLETGALTGKEQAVGLPAHMVEAASATLDLLTDYIQAEEPALYAECVAGGDLPARARVLDRAGRNLRLVALLEGDAAYLAEIPGVETAAWYPRYQAARRQLAGRRAEALRLAKNAFECRNPLGIEEEDIPLFTGQAVGGNEQFFASTKFLVARAQEEVDAATTLRELAKSAYIAQRQEQFQIDLEGVPDGSTVSLKQQRLNGIKAEFEGTLRKMCGAPAGDQTMLDAFLKGDLDARNCFFKTDLSECKKLDDGPMADVPAKCVRGELGNQLMTIKSASIDVANAANAVDRALQAYDGQVRFCIEMQEFHDGSKQIRSAHAAMMLELLEQRQLFGFIQETMNEVQSVALFAASGGTMGSPGGGGLAGQYIKKRLRDLEKATLEQQQAFENVMAERIGEQEVKACYQRADLQKLSIENERDLVKRALHSTETALSNYESAKDILNALVDDAAGQIALEAALDRAPPQFHYWLAENIEQFHRHMKHARRLSYLAVRAYEYETKSASDPDPTMRAAVLTARLPHQLGNILGDLRDLVVPIDGDEASRKMVLSLRDELLKLQHITGPVLPDGSPPLTSVQKLRQYLLSDAALIYDQNHNLIGRGIRFTVRPSFYTSASCSERIWRITPALVVDNLEAYPPVLLRQFNSFASQTCGEGVNPPLEFTRVQPHGNLLRGEVTVTKFTTPESFASMNLDTLNATRPELVAMPQDPAWPSGFAGRGLYGDFVLIFPKEGFPTSLIATQLNDVLLRFDYVELTNDSQPPPN